MPVASELAMGFGSILIMLVTVNDNMIKITLVPDPLLIAGFTVNSPP